MLKKILTTVLLSLTLFSCFKKENNEKLVIGVSPIPHFEIVNHIKDDLLKEGLELEIVVFNDYVLPNISLKDGSIDANFFQHVPYMESFAKENDMKMSSVGGIHLEPLKIYSSTLKNIDDVNLNSKVLIPNDPTNRGRSLILLEKAGLIKLNDITKLDSDISDIKENYKNIEIITLNSEQIGPRLSEVDLAIINTNNALATNISKDLAIFTEGKDSPYVNVVSVLKGNEKNEKILKLMKLLQSEKVKQFIIEKYNGEVEVGF